MSITGHRRARSTHCSTGGFERGVFTVVEEELNGLKPEDERDLSLVRQFRRRR